MRLHPLARSCTATATLIALMAGCGGGDGDGDTAATPSAPSTPVAPSATTDVSITVADGAIGGALVCLDKNGNGVCDTGETQGTTLANGNVKLAVPNADVGKYPVLAVIKAGAVDAVNGAVTVPYTMTAPADKPSLVTPLTTLVQQTVATTGVSTDDAAKAVQSSTGLTDLYVDLSTTLPTAAPGSVDPAAVARMVAIALRQQSAGVAEALNKTVPGSTAVITQADLDKTVRDKVLELVPALVAALASAPSTSTADLTAAAAAVVLIGGLTAAAAPTAIAIAMPDPASTTPRVAAAGATLASLTFTSQGNFSARVYTSTLAQDTPDASNNVRFAERRSRGSAGVVARWASGADPARNADLSWNGSAWVGCPINFENLSSVRDAAGRSTYTYCGGRETGVSIRSAASDISGRTMESVYADIVAAGYTNLSIANPATVLAGAVFPANASLSYQTSTATTEAVGYYPAGANLPGGSSNVVSQYSAAIAAGGQAGTQAAGTACNSAEASGNGTSTTTLEAMIATHPGTPCVFANSGVTYNGTTYTDSPSEWWGNSTVSLGTLGTASLTPSSTSTGFFTANTTLRVAFKGSGANPVTYYACKQRFVNGSPRDCTVIGTGSYVITTLGEGRALSFTNLPVATAALNYERVFVERGGAVYFGYRSKPIVNKTARLNTTATAALMTALGITPEDPATPLALTAASYQGAWEVRGSTEAIAVNVGTVVFVNANGTSSCQERSNSSFFACTVTITNPATGAFAYSDATGTAQGIFDFAAGTVSGTYQDPTSTPVNGSFVGGRR